MLPILIVVLSVTLVAASAMVIQTQRTGAAPIPSNHGMRAAVASLLREELARWPDDPPRVIDLGSGWGGLTRTLAAEFPSITFTGVELSIVPLIWSRLVLRAVGPPNVRFERRDLHSALDERASIFLAYLSPRHMELLARELYARSRMTAQGTLIISAAFALPGHTPDAVRTVGDLYRTPVYRYRLSCDGPRPDAVIE